MIFLMKTKIHILITLLYLLFLCGGCCCSAMAAYQQMRNDTHGLKLKRCPIPIPEGEIFTRYMWEDWGLRPPQQIPNDIENILVDAEFWGLFEFYPPIRDGKLYFEYTVFGSAPQFALQFLPNETKCLLHVSMPYGEPSIDTFYGNKEDESRHNGYHYTTDYTKTLTAVFYDGNKLVVTEDEIDKNNLPEFIKAYILTPLTEGEFYRQINRWQFPIFGSKHFQHPLPINTVSSIKIKQTHKAELAAVKREKLRKY